MLRLLKKQDSSFSHRAHAPLRTYLTHAALFEHVKRSFLHASYIWKQAIMWYQTFPIGDRNVMETGGCHSGRN